MRERRESFMDTMKRQSRGTIATPSQKYLVYYSLYRTIQESPVAQPISSEKITSNRNWRVKRDNWDSFKRELITVARRMFRAGNPRW